MGPGGGYSALASGVAVVVARRLECGNPAPLWLKLNLAPHVDAPSGVTVVQYIMYAA